MKYVLDASVAVAALRKTEPSHVDALRRCGPLFGGRDEIVVPAIFDIEVFSALVRRGAPPSRVTRLFALHFTTRRAVTIGPRAAIAVRAVVARTQLRAADALYVWLAAREGLELVTLDREVLTRAATVGVVAVPP
ncbi:MAG: type II toxin-antitoxin system VapC family toxin [Polyangiaceae bacterium]